MDMEKLLGRLTEQERRAWTALEKARKAGAPAEIMEQQRTSAAQTSERVTELKGELFHGYSRRR